jgi:ADP-heptose:LPS heptosyltransferase
MRNLEIWLKNTFIRFLSWIVRVKKIHKFPSICIKKILVIRQHNELGDMLCATPLLRAFKNYFPESSIDVISKPLNTDVVFNNPFINRVIEYDNLKYSKSLVNYLGFIRNLRAEKYDLAIVPCTVSVSVTSDLIAYLSKSKIRIGPSKIDGQKNMSGFLYNFPVELDWRKETLKHQTLRNIDILNKIGIFTDNLDLILNLTTDERDYGKKYFNNTHNVDKIAIGIHPGAGKKKNQWNAENFESVINKFMEEIEPDIYITCGPKDQDSVDYLSSVFGNKVNIIKEDSVRNVASIISNFNLFITNDTGIMHIAATTKCPVLSLFGPTDPLQWAPQRKIDKYLLGKNGDINAVPADKVFYTAMKMLVEHRPINYHNDYTGD